MFTAAQIVAHLFGDYVLQSDWMANNKKKAWTPAIAHVLTYGIPFLFIVVPTGQWLALAVIVLSHLAIDHWGLARYVVFAKNFLAPRMTYRTETLIAPGDSSGTITLPPGAEIVSNIGMVSAEGGFAVTVVIATREWPKWSECNVTGYHKDRPPWMAVWLLIIADNTLHLLCNAAALYWL